MAKSRRFSTSFKRRRGRYSSSFKRYRTSYKRKVYGTRFRKRSSYKPRQRFFRKAAPSVSGIPTKLYIHKAIASSVLMPTHGTLTDFICNTKVFSTDDLDILDEDLSTNAHAAAIRGLNPGRIFRRSNYFYGIGTSTVDPFTKIIKQTITQTGNVNPVCLLSLYSPMAVSYPSMMELNRFFGFPTDRLAALTKYLLNMPCVVYTTHQNDDGNNVISQISPLDARYFPADHKRNPADAQNNDMYAAANLYVNPLVQAIIGVPSFIEAAFNNAIKTVFNFDNENLRFTDIVYINASDGSYNFVKWPQGSVAYASSDLYVAAIRAHIPVALPGMFSYHDASEESPLYLTFKFDIGALGINLYRYVLTCCASLTPELKEHFHNFCSDMLSKAYILRAAGNLIGGSTLLGGYLSAYVNDNGSLLYSFKAIDSLLANKVIKITKLPYLKSVTYYPTTQDNAHFVCVSSGSTAKISTQFSRDYSGFMALFKNTLKQDYFRKELSVAGHDLFRRLEPSYNIRS